MQFPKILSFSMLISIVISGCSSSLPVTAPPAPQETLEQQGGGEPEIEAAVGFAIKQPSYLPEGYVLEKISMHEPTKSVCLQYRYADPSGDSVILIAQGPLTSAPPLELIPDLPDYLALREAAQIGGAKNSFHLEGYRRRDWACADVAASESTRFSYAVAIRYTWEVDQQQFDLYFAGGGCEAPGGATSLDLLRVTESLTGESTHTADELDPQCLHSVSDAEKISGFDVKEPTYLPPDVSFDYATYSGSPIAQVTLLFVHDQHKDAGAFFQIMQTDDLLAFKSACTEPSDKNCETIQVGNISVIYQFHDPTERLEWRSGSFFFSLFRSAGEPGKIYKEELLKIVESMQ